MDHWRINFIFTTGFLQKFIRIRPRIFNSFSSVIQTLGLMHYDPVITNTFQLLLSESDKGLIISKAAMYCIQYLCDPSHTRKMAKWHLRDWVMGRNHRKTRPWQWHRQASYHRQGRRPVLALLSHLAKLTLTTYRIFFLKQDDADHHLCPLHSPLRTYWRSNLNKPHYTREWGEYPNLLEYLPTILPRAGKFLPLIHLCKTKAFAPISMMFPDLSCRARRAIWKYLDRVDADA